MKDYRRICITGGSGFIGTNLIEYLLKMPNVEVLNIDIAAPKISEHKPLWRNVDIRETQRLVDVISDFAPDAFVHLAARTDLDGKALVDYSSNTDGTASIIRALASTGYRGPTIFASSMYVCRPGYEPISDTDYQPHTVYGQSKVIGEKLVRATDAKYPWVLVRPTSIWGPWFGVPYLQFFQMVLSKRYVHIAGDRTAKTYGYVGNTVAQIIAILDHCEAIKGQTAYLGDYEEYIISDWADEIAAFVPFRPRRVPRFIFGALARVGDVMWKLGRRFPMTSFRLANMTTSNVQDLSVVKGIISTLPHSRQQGNLHTVNWLKRVHR